MDFSVSGSRAAYAVSTTKFFVPASRAASMNWPAFGTLSARSASIAMPS